MRLRNTFLAKITAMALTGVLLSQSALADHHAPLDPKASQAAIIGAMTNEQNKIYHMYKQFEAKVLANPQAALEQMSEFIKNSGNYLPSSLDPDGINISKLDVVIKYQKNMPIGQAATVAISGDATNRAALVVTVHEAARRNPFVLLESLVNLNTVFNLGKAGATYSTVIPGKSIYHHTFDAFHSTQESLNHALGLNVSSSTYSNGAQGNMAYAELKANADAGSILSQRVLAETSVKNSQLVSANFGTFLPITMLNDSQKMAALVEYARIKAVSINTSQSYDIALQNLQDQIDLREKQQLDTLNAQAKTVYRNQLKELEAGAEARAQVDKTQSLSEMVKANDRAGVADAMEIMLPWAIMEPVEKVFWRDYVSAIRNPNYEGAAILFRGLDSNEKPQAVLDNSGRTVGVGLFSKRLTAGSGSHFYKMRGLRKTFESFGTNNRMKQNSPLVFPHTLTAMMSNHAGQPAGSPFISLTYDVFVAAGFSRGSVAANTAPPYSDQQMAKLKDASTSGGIATLRIDKRRILINSVSPFNSELEVLASMLIFPDEVLFLEKGTNFSVSVGKNVVSQINRMNTDEYYKKARSVVYQKTGINLPESYQEYAKQRKGDFQTGLTGLQDLFNRANPNRPMSCSKIFQ